MEAATLERYLARIGHAGSRGPELETLKAIQRGHLQAIAFEAIDVLLGRGVDLAPAAIERKLVAGGRGGYCFEQNGLLLRALRALGFDARGLLARVCWMAPEDAPPRPANHMALRVVLDGKPWLVDAGFGGIVPSSPLELDETGPQHCGHDTYRLVPRASSILVQALMADEWASMYELLPEPAADADFEVANWYTSTHPSSRFRTQLIAARTTAEARYALMDNRLTVRPRGGAPEQQYLDAAGIGRALASTFGLPVTSDWTDLIRRAAEAPRSEKD